jgi:aspartyl-tRNA(Asn)/glutamyl-tRNA(Gln) amidotransferase subunit C
MISKDKVEHIVKLARFALKEKEKEKSQKELSAILEYFKLLEQIDTSEISPTFYPFPLKNIFREDEEKKQSLETIEKLMDAVAEKEKGRVRVKAVL